MCDIRIKKIITFSLYLGFGLLHRQDQSALIVLYDYTRMCIYCEGDGLACFANLPTGLSTEGQKQAFHCFKIIPMSEICKRSSMELLKLSSSRCCTVDIAVIIPAARISAAVITLVISLTLLPLAVL